MITSYHLGDVHVCRTCGKEHPLTKSNFQTSDRIYPDCTDCHNAHRRELRKQNPEKYRKYDRKEYHQSRQEHLDRGTRKRRAKGIPPAHRVEPNDTRNYGKRYRDNHPHANAETKRRRKAQMASDAVSKVDYAAILQQYGRWCYICNQEIIPSQELHFDHILALSRGGIHHESNIRPTHAICNHRKKDKLISDLTDYDRRGPMHK